MKYRKKPIVIEAYQTDKELGIETLEGTMRAHVGDYIITGVRGEKYPCKPDIFEQTYEPADAPAASQWRRVEEPPEEEGRYLVASRCGKDNHWSYDLAYYTTKLEKAYFLEDGICGAGWYMWSDYEDCDICVSPDYWMPIEPPQEDA
jgi:hypothetical protein